MNQTALATPNASLPQTKIKAAEEGDGQDITLLSVSQALEREGLERVESIVRIPPDYQYAIPKWVHQNDVTEHDVVLKRGSGSFVAVGDKVGLTIDGYDYINRVLGASFFLPSSVHDENDAPKRNPIHRKDYIYLRLAAVWYTPLGQLVYASEDVEVDFVLGYMESRVSSKSASPVLDENGQVQWDERGNPLLKLSGDDEMKALKEFSTARNFGPRYAQSVARVRLLKMATGIRSLPIKVPEVYPLKFVSWRDQLTAQARIAAVTADVANLYGEEDRTKPLTAEEMAEAGAAGVVDETDLDREAVARAQEAQTEAAAASVPDPTVAAPVTGKVLDPEPTVAGSVVYDYGAKAPDDEPKQEEFTLDMDELDDLPPMRG